MCRRSNERVLQTRGLCIFVRANSGGNVGCLIKKNMIQKIIIIGTLYLLVSNHRRERIKIEISLLLYLISVN